VALVIDDVHILHNQEYWAALSMLADHVSVSSRLAPPRLGLLEG
jgi:hypothetical protein